MLKLLKIITISVFLLSSISSRAGVIETPLSEDSYISYQGLDWAWASSVNVQIYFDLITGDHNELKAPEFHDGWRFATAAELNILVNELTVSAFRRADNSYIIATAYWNTMFTGVNASDFEIGHVGSYWELGSEVDFKNYTGIPANYWYETFYVRDSQQTPAEPVPEPSTILIFSLGLIGLGLRKRIL